MTETSTRSKAKVRVLASNVQWYPKADAEPEIANEGDVLEISPAELHRMTQQGQVEELSDEEYKAAKKDTT
jgi:hypothetical protein